MPIRPEIHRRGLVLAALAAALVAGCGPSTSRAVREDHGKYPPPRVRLGPVIRLADRPAVKAAGALDNEGRVHLLVAAKSPKDVSYVVVDGHSRVREERLGGFDASTLLGFAPGLALDIAVDGKGRLRAVVAGNALLLEGGTWKRTGATPCRKFVRAGDAFYCAFVSPGKVAGASRQWELFGFGGSAGGIVFPWTSYPDTLVLMREGDGTWGDKAVLDPDSGGDVDVGGFAAAGDPGGTAHLVYMKTRALGLGTVTKTRYARVTGSMAGGERDTRPEASDGRAGIFRYRGTEVPLIGSGRVGLAADPGGGTAILVVEGQYEDENTPRLYSREIREGTFGPPEPLPLEEGHGPVVASAGAGKFHAAVVGRAKSLWRWTAAFPVFYLSREGGAWSSPAEIGRGIFNPDAFLLVSDASPRAFVAWPIKDGLEGRWVEPQDRESGDSLPRSADGNPAFPSPEAAGFRTRGP